MTIPQAVCTLFSIHNQTGNVWTHLLAFILFITLTIQIFFASPTPLVCNADHVTSLWSRIEGSIQHMRASLTHQLHTVEHAVSESTHILQHPHLPNITALSDTLAASISTHIQWPVHRWPVYVFMGGAMLLFMASTICHLLGCCAAHVKQVVHRLDYSAIAVLIVTSFFPLLYYGFLCDPGWQSFYLATTCMLGLCTLMLSLLRFFQGPRFRPVRAIMFSALGLWGIVPMVHQSLIYSTTWHITMAIRLEILMGALYLSGAALYALRIPERWYPGKFDVWGHSHQLFHIAVVAAALAHFKAVCLLLEWRDASGGCAVAVSRPVDVLLEEMKHLGHDVLHVDDVVARLHSYAHEHFGIL